MSIVGSYICVQFCAFQVACSQMSGLTLVVDLEVRRMAREELRAFPDQLDGELHGCMTHHCRCAMLADTPRMWGSACNEGGVDAEMADRKSQRPRHLHY